ncbi:MAG: SGNH/GDSL hydrolase family protein, partial [Lachnospiraceae bacterium]|nr:SGNH/GDSL hydrolase family protein [Lachnospiraceae bacterium]
MKRNDSNHNIHTSPVNGMPDIEIVDLENETVQDTDSGKSAHKSNKKQTSDVSPKADEYDDFSEEYEEEDYPEEDKAPAPAGIRRFLNVHVFFALVMIIVIGLVAYRFTHWGQRVSQSDIFKDGQGSYNDSWDSILPLTDENGQMVITDASNIVLFGNAPFADDRDSSDSLANLIAKETGANVYNCSISGSYLAAQELNFDPTVAAMDAYCLYWLVSLATGAPIDNYYVQAAEQLGDKTPADAEEVINTLKTLDFNTIDTVAIMYDATDYLLGNPMYNDDNPTDPTQFTGNLEASLDVLQSLYPQIRIIVMSPTYAYAVDENGDYVSSDMYIYNNRDVLSTYVIKECYSANLHSVSFMDNLYGSITEDNAKEYLTDNLHLNVKGRKLIAKRFEYFLNYYAKDYASQGN